MEPLDARGLRIGVVLHAVAVLLAGTPFARGTGVFDAFGLLLLAGAVCGYLTARLVTTDVDAAHTAFVGGAVGGLLNAVLFTTSVRADTASGVFWQLQYALATAGLPEWLVAGYGDVIVILTGFVVCTIYAFSALAGGALGAGELIQVERTR